MTAVATLVELGERYAALGLPGAARGAFARAHELSGEGDGAAARRLTELALASGDALAARAWARLVVDREGGPSSRVLLGRALLAGDQYEPARMAFAAALERAQPGSTLRARARLGQAAAAAATGDAAGAAATAMAAVDEFLAFARAPGRAAIDVDAELILAEEVISRAVACGRADDVDAALDALAAERPDAPVDLLRGILGSARISHGDDVPESEVEAAYAAELARRPGARAARLRLVERRLRRRYQDAAARAEAIAELEAIAEELGQGGTVGGNVELARILFTLAAAYEDDPGMSERAEDLYRRGLALRPGHAAAANRLALLTLARGDHAAAVAEIERALRIDAEHGLAWKSAARVLDASSPGRALALVVARLLDAANPGAGAAAGLAAPRLITATAEVARGDVVAGMYTRGHRLKNVLGIIGSRTRSARKLAHPEGELADKLRDLESEVMALYGEWSSYLRSMQTAGPVVEVLQVESLLAEVVADARQKITMTSAVPIALTAAASLPDLRGDRMLLREALVNIVSNAAEACAADGGRGGVEVRARAVVSGGTPLVEIEVADNGPGIARADLARVFAPGFTTKDSGSGIGLAVAERVVSAHHGRILVDSEVGRGTRVTVVLPSDLGGFSSLAVLEDRGAAEVE